jgi:D-alanyl-D-alanine dipeptidase
VTTLLGATLFMVKHRVAVLSKRLLRLATWFLHKWGLGWAGWGVVIVLILGFPMPGMGGATDQVLVDMHAIAPSIRLDLRYATTNNFTHQKLYAEARCLFRPQVAARLAKVQNDLKAMGLGLKVYDCYRPLSVQKRMWELVPDANYVADPKQGSRHNRGSAVDLTLVDATGKELPMPSTFDEFSPKSHLDYQGGSLASRQNRSILQNAMEKRGFLPYGQEWWHFDDPNWRNYPVLDLPLAGKGKS